MSKNKTKVHPQGKKVIIIGATSGIGRELARIYTAQGCMVGITGRREEKLISLKEERPNQTFYAVMDVRTNECVDVLRNLITEMGGVDLIIYSAGVGAQNPKLDPTIEMNAVATNADGYVRIAVYAYNYFKAQNKGHLAVISSFAGIPALRQAPAYSSTKRLQMHYTSCLAQKAHHENTPIVFTTILPGFIDTGMLKRKYPCTTSLEKGAYKIYKAIENKKRYATVPAWWKCVEWVWRIIPDFLWERFW